MGCSGIKLPSQSTTARRIPPTVSYELVTGKDSSGYHRIIRVDSEVSEFFDPPAQRETCLVAEQLDRHP